MLNLWLYEQVGYWSHLK